MPVMAFVITADATEFRDRAEGFLANPTSNKIYAEVGYRRFGDWEEFDFTRSRSAASPRSASA
jgi:hypothetical protein